jgi:thiol-disulfide isomerase/thioredoxin
MKRGIVDLLTGLAALFLFLLADTFLHIGADLRSALVSIGVLYLGAGLVRGRVPPAGAWRKGLLVSGGGVLALLVLAWNGMQHGALAALVLVAILFAVCGAHARHLPAPWSAAVASLALGLLAIVSTTTAPFLAARLAIRKVATAAPAFSFIRPDGTPISSADLRGRVVVLDFWATWCPACRRELPELERLYRKYQARSQVSFWAIDINTGGESRQKASEFMRQHAYTLPVAFDDRNVSDRLIGDSGFPSLLILDKSGRIRLIHTGYDRSERFQAELSGEIDGLLNERM